MNRKNKKTDTPSEGSGVRSFRVSDEHYRRALDRAVELDGMTFSRVMALLCEGYAMGHYDLPPVGPLWSDEDETK